MCVILKVVEEVEERLSEDEITELLEVVQELLPSDAHIESER